MSRANILALAALAGAVVGWVSATGVKSQTVRAADALVIGPLWIASAFTDPDYPVRVALAFVGGATIGYNARNYLIEEGRTL